MSDQGHMVDDIADHIERTADHTSGAAVQLRKARLPGAPPPWKGGLPSPLSSLTRHSIKLILSQGCMNGSRDSSTCRVVEGPSAPAWRPCTAVCCCCIAPPASCLTSGPRSLQGERSQRGTRNRQCILFIIAAVVLVVLFLVLSS